MIWQSLDEKIIKWK